MLVDHIALAVARATSRRTNMNKIVFVLIAWEKANAVLPKRLMVLFLSAVWSV